MNANKELRIKNGDKILALITRFSATEKMLFGVLTVALVISAAFLIGQVNGLFLVSVPTQGGELTEGVVGLPRLINPILAFSDTDKDLSALIYAGLMKYKNGALVPDLASSYDTSADGLTYTFTLKNNLRFQDGTPLTADDVVFTINKIQDPVLKSPLRANWANITAKALAPNQVQFTLKQVYSPFLANTTVGILPKHIWNNVGADQFIFSQYNIEPVGAGPYKLENILHDNGGIPTVYTLVPSANGYDAPAFISKINIHFYSDEKTAVDAYTAGDIESLASISPADAVAIASSTPDTRIITSPLPRIFGVFFNQNQAPVLADKSVRQALNMVVDKNQIVKEVLNGYGTAVDSPVPVAASETLTPPSSVDAATALLVKNGWTMGASGIYEKKIKNATTTLAFSISTPDSPDLKMAAQILKRQWSAIGARVTVKVFDASNFNQNVIGTRNYDAILFGESVGNSVDLYAFWHSSQRNAPGLNIAMYVNSQADKLLEAIRAESDANQKAADYSSFVGIIRNDVPAVFLYSPDFMYVLPDKIRGAEIDSVATPADRWSNVAAWYIDTESVWKFFIRKQ